MERSTSRHAAGTCTASGMLRHHDKTKKAETCFSQHISSTVDQCSAERRVVQTRRSKKAADTTGANGKAPILWPQGGKLAVASLCKHREERFWLAHRHNTTSKSSRTLSQLRPPTMVQPGLREGRRAETTLGRKVRRSLPHWQGQPSFIQRPLQVDIGPHRLSKLLQLESDKSTIGRQDSLGCGRCRSGRSFRAPGLTASDLSLSCDALANPSCF